MKTSFLSKDEIRDVGFARCGKNVLISRKASLYSPEKIELGNNVRIDDFCILSGPIVLGNYIHIAAYSALFADEKIVIQNYANISSRVSIYAVSDDFLGHGMTNPTVPAKYRHVHTAPVVLGEHAIIGAGSVILPGVTLGTGAAIGALSLVTSDCEPWTVYTGIPAQPKKGRRRDLILRYQAELEADLLVRGK
ncbi:MAG: acyltransferase [Deltaproteobacteria bacterium]|nr:acyltransferase [Deltaproteobacteria bacterium]